MGNIIDLAKINKRATIEIRSEISDDCGGFIINFMPLKKIWCSIENMSYNENFFLMKKNIIITHKITTRFDPIISIQNSRLNYNGVILEIQFISVLETTTKWLEIYCKEQTQTCRQ